MRWRWGLNPEREEFRRKYIDPMWPSHVTAWRLCVVPGRELLQELQVHIDLGDEAVLFEGSHTRCLAVFYDALKRYPHAAEGDWCLRQVHFEPYGEPVLLARLRQAVVHPDSPDRCLVNMVHPDKSEARCVLHKDHQEDDTDHLDEHGHTAHVLVHQSTIREVRAVSEARERGEIV